MVVKVGWHSDTNGFETAGSTEVGWCGDGLRAWQKGWRLQGAVQPRWRKAKVKKKYGFGCKRKREVIRRGRHVWGEKER